MKASSLSKSISRRKFLEISSKAALGLGLSGVVLNGVVLNSVQAHGHAMGEKMIEVNGTSLFHDSVGSGIPILVMHGGLGLDHSYFRPTLDSWGDFAELHFYDHRGNGRSAEPSDWNDVTLNTYVEDAEALRQSLGLDKFVLYGHSYGGFIAQEYALRYQDNLAGLILASTSPNVGYAPNFPAWAPEAALESVGKLFAGPMANDQEWSDTWSSALPVYWKNPDPTLAADIHDRTHYNSAAWNNALGLLADFNTAGRLGEIDVPTLLLGGREDFITGPTAHSDMHQELPKSTLAIFEQSGHFPFITEKNAYKAVVQTWVSKL